MQILTLYDIGGNPLASFKERKPFQINNVSFEATIQADGRLRLFSSVTNNNRAETHARIISNLKNEFSQRKKDLVLIKEDIATLLKKIQQGGENIDELASEMGRMLVLKGQHNKRIYQIQNQAKVTVEYEKKSKIYSVLLREGVFTKLDWFANAVMWCGKMEMRQEEKIELIAEDIPIQRLYAIGGKANENLLSSVEQYDINLDRWISIPPMNTTRYAMALTVCEGHLYALGGYNSISLSSAEHYNPKEKKWTNIPNMLSTRYCHSAAVLYGQLYVVGGYDKSCLSSVECYDPKKKKWMYVASIKKAKNNLAVAGLNGKLYAIGGQQNTTSFSSMERYDPDDKIWTNMPSMSSARNSHSVAVLNDQIYVMGGYNKNDKTALSSVERYDPEENKWVSITPLSCERYGASAAVLNGQIYIAGGRNDNVSCLSTVERYDLEQNKWLTVSDMISARKFHSLAVVGLQL